MRSKKILSLEEDLEAMIVAADNPEVREFLEAHLQEYKRGDFRPLQIVVLSDASPEGTELQNMFNAWLDTPEQRRLIDNHTLAISIQSAAENLSHVPDCVDLLFIPHSALGLLKEINGAAILFLMVPEGTPLTKKEKNEMRKQFPILLELTQQEIQDIDAYIKPFLTERMKLVLDEYADAKRLALAEEWLLLKIEQLDYAGRGKKEQIRQKLAMISDTGRDNPFQSVKKEIDQRVREFVYHAEIRLEEAWSGSGAVHTQRLIEVVATLSELESTVQAKKKVVRLPSGFREKLTGQFQEYLQTYVKEDIQRTLAFIHLTKQVIGEHLERHGLPSDSILRDLNPRMGREDDLVRFSRLNREFEASSSARSTYEILMKIRMMPMMLFMF